jgi:sterol desaturase/sphingolipid hydroxylase (fatty acid hydroxylase superfamily)
MVEPSVWQFSVEVATFKFDEWGLFHYAAYFVLFWIAMGILQNPRTWDRCVWVLGKPFTFKELPATRGPKPLADDQLQSLDLWYVRLNAYIVTPIYLLQFAQYVLLSDYVDWSLVPPLSVLAQIFGIFAVFDFFYVPGHRLMHVPAVYPWIHKFHHRQFVPFRGAWDGMLVTPAEYLFGTYLHLFSFRVLELIVSRVGARLSIAAQVHVVVLPIFLVTSMVCACVNHTRYDVYVPGFFHVSDHAVHHAHPPSNYGQFTMWWDKLYGSYKPFRSLELKTD